MEQSPPTPPAPATSTSASTATAAHHCRSCGQCVHFCNAPADLETAFQGISIMSSAHASVRWQDGLCLLHDVYLSIRDTCANFVPASSCGS